MNSVQSPSPQPLSLKGEGETLWKSKMLADFVEVTTSDGVLLGGAYFAPTVQERSSSVEAICFFPATAGTSIALSTWN